MLDNLKKILPLHIPKSKDQDDKDLTIEQKIEKLNKEKKTLKLENSVSKYLLPIFTTLLILSSLSLFPGNIISDAYPPLNEGDVVQGKYGKEISLSADNALSHNLIRIILPGIALLFSISSIITSMNGKKEIDKKISKLRESQQTKSQSLTQQPILEPKQTIQHQSQLERGTSFQEQVRSSRSSGANKPVVGR
jgi:hypothetical protein